MASATSSAFPEVSRMSRLALVVLAVVPLGCGAPPSTARVDLLAYLQRSKTWAPVEAETAQTIERILRTEFVDEAEVQRQIVDSRPRILGHLERVRAYNPRSDAVEQVHTRYISAWQELISGYDAIEAGFASGDYTKLARGREAMARWREEIIRVAADLRALAQHLGVDPADAAQS